MSPSRRTYQGPGRGPLIDGLVATCFCKGHVVRRTGFDSLWASESFVSLKENIMLRFAICLVVLAFAGCSSLDNVDKVLPASAVMSVCDSCGQSGGGACTSCCTACAIELCYNTCQRHPPDCDMCEENAYWDCYQYRCMQQD